eukprot:scaffold34878_cov101-Isochrysis_galbana.AAC.5
MCRGLCTRGLHPSPRCPLQPHLRSRPAPRSRTPTTRRTWRLASGRPRATGPPQSSTSSAASPTNTLRRYAPLLRAALGVHSFWLTTGFPMLYSRAGYGTQAPGAPGREMCCTQAPVLSSPHRDWAVL